LAVKYVGPNLVTIYFLQKTDNTLKMSITSSCDIADEIAHAFFF